jgi:cyclic nucleotide-binding protein
VCLVLCRGVATAFVTSVTSSRVATVARLRPGDVIGEVGFITNLPRSASVIARSDAELLEIAREDFARLLVRHPELLTLYDHLVLSLRPKDVIATFNWDPFLIPDRTPWRVGEGWRPPIRCAGSTSSMPRSCEIVLGFWRAR